MSYEIRALSVAEILDQSFRILRDRFGVLWGIAAIVYVPLGLAGSLSQPDIEPGTLPPTESLIASAVLALASLTIIPVTQLAITHAVSETYLGRDIGIASAYAFGRTLWVRYLGTGILMVLGVIAGFLLLIIPGFYLLVVWMIVGPVIVAERLAGTAALGRSRELLRDNWWRGFGVFILSSLVFFIVGGGVQLLFQFIPFVGGILTGMANAVAFAFSSCVLVVFYFELRCRHEDFDLQILGAQIARSSGSEPAAG